MRSLLGIEVFAEIFDSLEPRTAGQRELKRALLSQKDLVGAFGPTGTGKSLFAISYGLAAVERGKFKRLVISRPIVDVVTGREITLFSEPKSYVEHSSQYLADIISGFADPSSLQQLPSGKLLLADPHFLRGRTFDDSVMVLDDAQSVPAETIVEIITRMGRNSRLIVAGDPVFQRPAEGRDGATLAREILLGEETAAVVDLGLKDMVRPGAQRGAKLLLELVMRRRALSEEERRVREIVQAHAPDAEVVTVASTREAKRKWEVEGAPDFLLVAKEGYLGRLIGSGGERIQAIEREAGAKVRAVQLELDFKDFIRALHPVSWIHKHIVDVDIAGNSLLITVSKGNVGPMVGQRGSYARFLSEAFNKLMGLEVRVEERAR